ncbi:hypothetical protein Pelo_5402 [Pelomyxa schiedti]|nr:hypothetical protein Pelo_5402 [Pelomyxa schiedti]
MRELHLWLFTNRSTSRTSVTFDMTEGPEMDTITIPVTPFVSSGQNCPPLHRSINSNFQTRCFPCYFKRSRLPLSWLLKFCTAPYCGFVHSTPCCSRIRDYIDQIVFVAQERLRTGCLHINDIYLVD